MWWRETPTLSIIFKRSLVSHCCGTGSEGIPECSPRRWCCSIFPALPPFLQPEEVTDLKLFFAVHKRLYFKCSVPDKMSPKIFVLMCITAALWYLLTLRYNGSCSLNLEPDPINCLECKKSLRCKISLHVFPFIYFFIFLLHMWAWNSL